MSNSTKQRPKLNFSTIPLLWNPLFALKLVDQTWSQRGEIKPSFFKPNPTLAQTEVEKYTIQIIHSMCAVAFGMDIGKDLPGRKQIWTANANWIRYQLPIGKGIDLDGLKRCIVLYSQHACEDNA